MLNLLDFSDIALLLLYAYSSCPAFSQFDWLFIEQDSAILPDDSAAKQNWKRTSTKIVSKFSENVGKL